MIRRASFLILSLALPLLLAGLLFHVSAAGQPPEPGKIGPALREHVQDQPENNVRFLVEMRGQVDLSRGLPAGEVDRRGVIVQRLQETARRGQADLLRDLTSLQASGRVVQFRPLWIVNAVAVEGHPAVLPRLAARDDVSQIVLDERIQYVPPLETVSYSGAEAGWNLSRVRAQHVWHGLGVTGTGVTVGIMDSGVDWLHPDLRGNYRGDDGSGPVVHEGSWYDAVDPGNEQPFDPVGHGTHVAGTIGGANGIGVAPGIQWVAVRVFDENGTALLSTLHEGFQWLLAPAGNPALAPDVVNGSWGGPSLSPAFLEDVDALKQAGIVPVFAAGNDGPQAETISTPAAYTDTIAVAASDDADGVAWFSSRGPSSFSSKHKPDLAAPGSNIYSTLPENTYGYSNGTSMAAPHVSGAAALLLSTDPALSTEALIETLAETAVPVGETTPDFSSGWGRIDAYAAVASAGSFGDITGVVRGEAGALPGATLTITTPGGEVLRYKTDEAGRYRAWLRPGEYRILAGKYGYSDSPAQTVSVTAGASASQDLQLARLPYGRVHGRVTDAASEDGLRATITILSAPVTVTVDDRGFYSLELPAGQSYVLRAEQGGYRLQESAVTVAAGGSHRRDFALEPTTSILLVDSGRWYYDSRIAYYRQALIDAGYGFDEWTIDTPQEAPTADEMAAYELVIWSAPQDAPGRVGAGGDINEYLDEGGNLLISGQNVARLDGIGPTSQSWWYNRLGGVYLGTATPPFSLSGFPETPFAGLTLALNGPDGAQNQVIPSKVGPRDGTLTRPVLAYSGGEGAALHSGWCRPFEIVFLGFGLEGVSPAGDRASLVEASLATITAPPVNAALSLEPAHSEGIVLSGETVTYSLRLRNLSEVLTTTIGLNVDSAWDASVSTPSLSLGPCQAAPVTVTLQVPPGLPTDSVNTLTLQADADNGSEATATINSKTPAQYLLVDDHRWYDQTELYGSILDHFDLGHDVWSTEKVGSPRSQLLQAYDMVFWYTAYDWFEPVPEEEAAALAAYLESGGRLFLSSQDYLYYNLNRALTRQYLGVLDYTESVTPTKAIGGAGTVMGDPAGPFPLSYDPYQNFSDGLTPADGAHVHLWNDRGLAAGVASARDGWRSVFWGFPFETLPLAEQQRAFGSVLGWLSDAGDSALEMSPRVGPHEAPRSYTLTVRNGQSALPNPMTVTATVDADLVVEPTSVTGGADFDAATRQITWQGLLEPGGIHQIAFLARPAGPDIGAGPLDVTSRITYGSNGPAWERTSSTWIGDVDMVASSLEVTPQKVLPGKPVTYSLRLDNDGAKRATGVSATLHLPRELTPITSTLSAESGTATLADNRVHWKGDVAARSGVTIRLQLKSHNSALERFIASGAVIDDGLSSPFVRSTTLHLAPRRWLFPVVRR